jgi:MFS transporter, DHA3 family, macrolide efflux protein
MRILSPLRDRQVALLFWGQLLSCIGDEVYSVALTWFAVSLIGQKAGYLSALQAASLFVCSLFAGIWADRWDQRKTLITADVIRGVAVLIPVLVSYFTPVPLGLLVAVALVEASLAGLFFPALRSMVPEIVEDRSLLNATNGLMEATTRLARVIGPGFVAILGRRVPLIHFFTIDALSFFSSAISVKKTGPVPCSRMDTSVTSWTHIKDGIFSGAKIIFDDPELRFATLSGVLSTPAWYLVLPLSMALLIHERMPDRYSALGLFIAAYGVGNVIGNIWAGSVEIKRPKLFLCWGRFVAGVGFVLVAFAPNFPLLLLTAAIAASGGPLTDLGFLLLVQNRHRGQQAARVFRFHLAYTQLLILIAFVISPWLFQRLGVALVICGCGLSIAISGALGLVSRRPAELTR